MEYLVTTNVIVVIALIVKEFVLPYSKHYLKWKARNRASIEDSDQLTRIVEGVKLEFANSLESYKSELIHRRSKMDWQRAEYKEKVMVYQRLASLLVEVMSNLKLHHAITSGAYASLSISRLPGIELVYKNHCLKTHNDILPQMQDHYILYKDLILKLKAVAFEVDIYFDSSVSEPIHEITAILEHLSEPAIMQGALDEMALVAQSSAYSMDALREQLRGEYDSAWLSSLPSDMAVDIISQLRTDLREQADVFN